MQIDRDEFSREAADVSELLALHGMRRGLESKPAVEHDAEVVAEVTPPDVSDLKETVHQLTELIAAIDRRLPQVQRSGEAAIANTAMRLRSEAQERIDELKREVDGREHTSRPHTSV